MSTWLLKADLATPRFAWGTVLAGIAFAAVAVPALVIALVWIVAVPASGDPLVGWYAVPFVWWLMGTGWLSALLAGTSLVLVARGRQPRLPRVLDVTTLVIVAVVYVWLLAGMASA